jgi:hypothetical protein
MIEISSKYKSVVVYDMYEVCIQTSVSFWCGVKGSRQHVKCVVLCVVSGGAAMYTVARRPIGNNQHRCSSNGSRGARVAAGKGLCRVRFRRLYFYTGKRAMHKIPSNALHFPTERLSSIVLADSNVSESGTPSSRVLHSSSYNAGTGWLFFLSYNSVISSYTKPPNGARCICISSYRRNLQLCWGEAVLSLYEKWRNGKLARVKVDTQPLLRAGSLFGL